MTLLLYYLYTIYYIARMTLKVYSEVAITVPDVEVVADTGVVDFNSDVQGRIQNILTEKDLE